MTWLGRRGFAAAAAVAALAPPSFAPAVKLPGAAGGDEPRIAIASDDQRYAIANDASNGSAVVFSSADRGATWRRTPSTFGGQTSATIDTDVAVTPSGRIVAVELDGAGLSFAIGYSDDGGATWTQSRGATLADQDRPWLAVGPGNHVYLLFHNLASGGVQHEMLVSTSADGGATFSPPVPVAPPGSQAYLDLQCADSGAPSALLVNRRSGRLYAVFGTRTSQLGGCGASVFGTPEANVVGETRVWVATSPDGSAGSWSDVLAADAGDKVVSASFEAGALDSAGNVYVAWAQTANPYPDFSQASIRYASSGPDASRWSSPVTLVPAGPVGHYDPSLVAGDPGELALAYFTGYPRAGADPVWYVQSARVSGATSPGPRVAESRVSPIPAYAQSANAMGGSCASGPAAGLENGSVCDRATDDWGLALDSRCDLAVVFPTVANDAPGASAGTWAAVQNGGSRACAPGPASPEAGPPALRRRIEIEHLGGRAAALDRRWRRRGAAELRARTARGTATAARGFLYRVTRAGRLRLVARSHRTYTLTRRARTLRLGFVRGARLVRGRYVTSVTATVDGRRVTRARRIRLR
jgi:hypothetical protein